MNRRNKRRMIRAASNPQSILSEVVSVEWIQASEGSSTESDSPKRFKMRAYTGGPMQVGYYGAPVVIDMAGLTVKAPLPILMNHDMGQIVGHADEINSGDSTLDLSGIVSGASDQAEQVLASSKLGFPWKASVGARPDKMEFVGEGITTKVNGKTLTGPLYVARKSTLGEVSFVAMAADSKTNVKVAASAAHSNERKSKMDFEQWLQAKGFDAATLTKNNRKFLKASFDDETETPATEPEPTTSPVADPPADPAKTMRAAAAAEATRIAAIGKICGDKFAEIQAKAIAEGWNETKTELEVIRAERPAPTPINGSSRDNNPSVIEAALCISAGLSKPESHYKPEVIEAAQSKAYRNLGIQEILLMQARAAGYTGRMNVTAGNLREVIEAAFSTTTITTLLTTAGNKLLLDGFSNMPQSWRDISSIRTVNDFKTVTAYRMTASLEYEEVGPAGEIKHGTLGQESYTMNALTYAKMLALTRQDIINDDLGAFNDIRNRLGMGAAMKMNRVFWTAFLSASNGGAFWTAARGNLITGAPLAEAGLTTAVAAFRNMSGPDGNLMNLQPTILLVPPALETTAKKIYTSQEVRDTTASTKSQTANIFQNQFRPVVVPELGISSYTGYSATTWYLLCDPRILASAVMCFLNGQESPTIESADADFDTLGIQFRGFHDFGVAMTEYRASLEAQA